MLVSSTLWSVITSHLALVPYTISFDDINSTLTLIQERLVTHLHDFARETRLSTNEWMAALNFLVQVGQISSDVRHEFILLSDILGLSLLVDAIDHPKPPASTEGSVLGPFHTHEAEVIANGEGMSSDPAGEPCLVLCTVKDVQGKAIEGVKIDIWETDSTGHYDVQYNERDGPDGRCVMKSDTEGEFWFKAIVPVPYPIPHDGPVGKLLKLLGRHPWRYANFVLSVGSGFPLNLSQNLRHPVLDMQMKANS
jgi:protocatechuate 3,4-dioxygenase beta subunit